MAGFAGYFTSPLSESCMQLVDDARKPVFESESKRYALEKA